MTPMQNCWTNRVLSRQLIGVFVIVRGVTAAVLPIGCTPSACIASVPAPRIPAIISPIGISRSCIVAFIYHEYGRGACVDCWMWGCTRILRVDCVVARVINTPIIILRVRPKGSWWESFRTHEGCGKVKRATFDDTIVLFDVFVLLLEFVLCLLVFVPKRFNVFLE